MWSKHNFKQFVHSRVYCLETQICILRYNLMRPTGQENSRDFEMYITSFNPFSLSLVITWLLEAEVRIDVKWYGSMILLSFLLNCEGLHVVCNNMLYLGSSVGGSSGIDCIEIENAWLEAQHFMILFTSSAQSYQFVNRWNMSVLLIV